MRRSHLSKPDVLSSANHSGQTKLGLSINPARATVSVNGQPIHLTVKEFQALSYLHSRDGALCTKDELAQHVWPEYEGAVDDYNIEQLVSRLRRKLEPDPQRPRFLLTVRGLGYRLETPRVSERITIHRARLPSRSILLSTFVLIIAAAGIALALVLPSGRDGRQPGEPIGGTTRQGPWLLKYGDAFDNPETSLFPRGPGSTPAGLIFSRSVEGQEYLVRIMKVSDRSSGLSALAPPVSFETFAFEAEAQSNGSIQYGLTLFWNSADSLQIRLNPASMSYELYHSLEGSLISRESSPLVKTGDLANHLRFEIQGNRLSVIINGTLAETVALDSIGRRPVTPGLFVWVQTGRAVTEYSGTKVLFDNFQLFAAEGD